MEINKVEINKAEMLDSLVNWLRDEFEGGQSQMNLEQTKAQWLMLRFLPRRMYEPTEPIAAGSLVTLETGGRESLCLLVPAHGGLVTRWKDHALQLVTPDSPLGSAILGKMKGNSVEVALSAGNTRSYLIKDCC